MARGTSRYGKVMIDDSSAANAAPVVINWIGDWNVDNPEPPTFDASAMGDTRQTLIAGLVGAAKVTINGFADLSASGVWTQIADAQIRNTYIYPDFTNAPTKYWMGKPAFGGGVTGAVADAIKVNLVGSDIGGTGQWNNGL